jgi:hypothetical protein
VGVLRISAGAHSARDLASAVTALESIVTNGTLQQAFAGVADICRSAAGALRDDAIPQPQVATRLPYRFAVPAPADSSSLPITELEATVARAVSDGTTALEALGSVLMDIHSTGSIITQRLAEFHRTLSALLVALAEMRASTWNPHSQNELAVVRENLVNAGDAAIDATRLRLLAADNWRETARRFLDTARSILEGAITSARTVVAAVQADLAVTSDAERKLVAAARSVAGFLQRLERLRPTPAEKQASIGESSIGGDILDIGTPIVTTVAALIEAAQQQTKFMIMKDRKSAVPKLFVAAADEAVASLEAFLSAAAGTVRHDEGALAKLTDASGKLAAAVNTFQADAVKKGGSPELTQVVGKVAGTVQAMLQQLGAFVGAAERSKAGQAQRVSVKRISQSNPMTELLNAEARVVSCRRALQFAEDMLKELSISK